MSLNAYAVILLALVTAQRLGELVYARANERRLRAEGAVEVGAAHYPLIVAMHAAWLIVLWLFGAGHALSWLWTGVYVLLQVARGWVLGSIGRRWTTRVFVRPGETLVRRGAYRWISHPNYAVVIAEMFVLPLAVRLPWASLLFGVLNLAVLWWRIRVEARALAEHAAPPAAPPLARGRLAARLVVLAPVALQPPRGGRLLGRPAARARPWGRARASRGSARPAPCPPPWRGPFGRGSG